ncbi:hypothetical protein CLV72_1011280 [Allonocardiopsis opalescens]|uniref:Uncharacterized protein n=1 Tax=Allonocardiopsis opalescens TaxID=1144618 RepID=A0A2T0QFG4_9ACTN|nr:hypothetical protein CLV72_1011280 [Allonocardiopsis opalescens]
MKSGGGPSRARSVPPVGSSAAPFAGPAVRFSLGHGAGTGARAYGGGGGTDAWSSGTAAACPGGSVGSGSPVRWSTAAQGRPKVAAEGVGAVGSEPVASAGPLIGAGRAGTSASRCSPVGGSATAGDDVDAPAVDPCARARSSDGAGGADPAVGDRPPGRGEYLVASDDVGPVARADPSVGAGGSGTPASGRPSASAVNRADVAAGAAGCCCGNGGAAVAVPRRRTRACTAPKPSGSVGASADTGAGRAGGGAGEGPRADGGGGGRSDGTGVGGAAAGAGAVTRRRRARTAAGSGTGRRRGRRTLMCASLPGGGLRRPAPAPGCGQVGLVHSPTGRSVDAGRGGVRRPKTRRGRRGNRTPRTRTEGRTHRVRPSVQMTGCASRRRDGRVRSSAAAPPPAWRWTTCGSRPGSCG